MRVLAPRRIIHTGYDRVTDQFKTRCMGIPLDGEWRDVPDYFVQVTSGLPDNDVTHAKLVDPVGLTYTTFNGTVNDSRHSEFLQTRVGHSGASVNCMGVAGVCYTNYTSEWIDMRIDPSPNYKGKHPRRSMAKVEIRTLYPFTLLITGLSWNTSGSLLGTLFTVCLPKDTPPGSTLGSYVSHSFTLYEDHVVGSDSNHTSFLEGLGIVGLVTGPGYNLTRTAIVIDEFMERITPRVVRWVTEYYDALRDAEYFTALNKSAYIYQLNVEDFPDYDPRSGYLLSEDYLFGERLEPQLLGIKGNTSNYWINYLTEHALLSACESLPRLNDNTIQNLLEVAGFIKSLVVDRKIEIPKSLADAWLAYRYTYGTGKADIEEAIKFVHRRMDLGTLDREIVGHGSSSKIFDDGTRVQCRCRIAVKPRHLDKLKEIWRALDTYGLTPDFYVIWDSIPYSFMVDWFLPIGDLASVEDVNAMYFSGEYYTLGSPLFSLSYTREMDPIKIHCYTRWVGSVPSSLHSRYWFEPPSASFKTVGKRVLDAASIFIGS